MALDELVDEALHGEPRARSRAWRALVQEVEAQLVPYFTRRVNEAEAKDLVQRTLLAVVRKLPSYEVRAGEPFRAWVFGVARLELRKARQSEQRRRLQQAALARRCPTPTMSLGSRMQRAMVVEFLDEAIARLPTGYRRAIEIYLATQDVGAVAAHEQLAPGAARTRLHRARKALREQLEARSKTPQRSSPGAS